MARDTFSPAIELAASEQSCSSRRANVWTPFYFDDVSTTARCCVRECAADCVFLSRLSREMKAGDELLEMENSVWILSEVKECEEW